MNFARKSPEKLKDANHKETEKCPHFCACNIRMCCNGSEMCFDIFFVCLPLFLLDFDFWIDCRLSGVHFYIWSTLFLSVCLTSDLCVCYLVYDASVYTRNRVCLSVNVRYLKSRSLFIFHIFHNLC